MRGFFQVIVSCISAELMSFYPTRWPYLIKVRLILRLVPDSASESAQISTTPLASWLELPQQWLLSSAVVKVGYWSHTVHTAWPARRGHCSEGELGDILEAESLKPHGDNFARWEEVDRKGSRWVLSPFSHPQELFWDTTVLQPSWKHHSRPHSPAELSQGFGQLSMLPRALEFPVSCLAAPLSTPTLL